MTQITVRQGSGGKDIFKYRWIHQQCGNGWKVINITLIPLLGILETNSLSERIWLGANPQPYVQRKISLHSRKNTCWRLSRNEAPLSLPFLFCFAFTAVSFLRVSSSFSSLLQIASASLRHPPPPPCRSFSLPVRTWLCCGGCDCVSACN